MHASFRLAPIAIAVALLATACVSRGESDPAAQDLTVRATGTIAAIDIRPWTYDGHAVVQVDTADGRLDVQLPARWNLCEAGAVDVQALAVGMQVEVVGASEAEGVVVVCAGASHRLVPLSPG